MLVVSIMGYPKLISMIEHGIPQLPIASLLKYSQSSLNFSICVTEKSLTLQIRFKRGYLGNNLKYDAIPYQTKENENVCLSVCVKCNWFFGQIVNPRVAEFIRCFITDVRFISYSKCSNCCRTLDVYLLAIWMGQIQSKLVYIFVTYELTSL